MDLVRERAWRSVKKFSTALKQSFNSVSFPFLLLVVVVVGLKRTGKSCRLRWVNYLNPELKRGKMTSKEERLVLELHSKWGNRWSRIARRLPGRTDNEIKNYWRTYMRKEARDNKKKGVHVSPLSAKSKDAGVPEGDKTVEEFSEPYTMDEIWKDIEENSDHLTIAASSPWWNMADSIWTIAEGEEHQLQTEWPVSLFPLVP